MMDVLRPGEVIDDRFTLVRPLGSGALGSVWLAQDAQREGAVAIKILHPHVQQTEIAAQRLAREGALLARLDHPNIASAISFSSGERAYLAMELASGLPLDEALGERTRQGRHFPISTVQALFQAICSAIDHAHQLTIVHRDLKPQNVMLEPDAPAAAKVLDFGIAKLLGTEVDATTMGRKTGSLFYRSPEQSQGGDADERSDVFALGAILFEVLTLRRAWARDAADHPAPAFKEPLPASKINSVIAVTERIRTGDRPRASAVREGLPPSCDQLFERALASDPDRRFQSVAALERAAAAELDRLNGLDEAVHAEESDAETDVMEKAKPAIPPTEAYEKRDFGGPESLGAEPTARLPERSSPRRLLPIGVILALLLFGVGIMVAMRASEQRVPVVPVVRSTPPVEPELNRFAEVEELLQELRAEPNDAAMAGRLRDRIVQLAQQVTDPEEKKRITRVAQLSAVAGNVAGFHSCIERLKQAE